MLMCKNANILDEKFLKKRKLKILLVVAIILTAIIVFRYEIAYNYALKSIPYDMTYKDGAIIVSQDLNNLRNVLDVKYNSDLFEKANRICVIISIILLFVCLNINRMCRCKSCKKQIAIRTILKSDFFECPYCGNTEK